MKIKQIKLSDDMLLLLAKYITDRDCLALALSGVSERFTLLYGNRRRLAIGRSYFLTANSWKVLIQDHISSVSIKVLDISNIYWISAEALTLPISQMVNLEELSIQDTQITLSHLPRIFDACQKIVKFSFTLEDTNREKFRKDLRRNFRCMKLGFSRLVHLKFFIFTCNHSESLLVLFEMLGWCRDCVELILKADDSQNPEVHRTLEADQLEKIARKELFPRLRWMGKLKSLALLGKKDYFDLFLHWFYEERVGSPNVLERMWYTDGKMLYDLIVELYGPHAKSFIFDGREDNYDLKEKKFEQLEHVGGIIFREFNYLRNLKYVSGFCRNNFKGLNAFCKSHPKLERLHIRTYRLGQEIFEDDAHQKFGYGDWSLPSLKVFSYACFQLRLPAGPLYRPEGVVEHVVKACPNLDELNLLFVYGSDVNIDCSNIFSKIRFHHLTTLNIVGSTLGDGSYLPLIIENCRKLECLHLEQLFSREQSMSNVVSHLVECLPKASKLRDLRLQWAHNCKEDLSYFSELFDALLKCSSHLERFVYMDWGLSFPSRDCSCRPDNLLLQVNGLVSFVAKMKRLVAFCLAGPRIDLDFAEIVKQRLTDEILPLRPALCFHLGKYIPKVGDPCVPRVHYDQILEGLNPPNSYTPF